MAEKKSELFHPILVERGVKKKRKAHSSIIYHLSARIYTSKRQENHCPVYEPCVSSDGGVLYLQEIDRQIGLIDTLVAAIQDNRRQTHIPHEPAELLRQRTYQISCGYEDADDCDHLRTDPAFKTTVGRDPQTILIWDHNRQ